MTLEDRCRRLPLAPLPPRQLVQAPRERLAEATRVHLTASREYATLLAGAKAALEDQLARRYISTVTVTPAALPGWLRLSFQPSVHHPEHAPAPIYRIAEAHGLHLAPMPSEQPHEYRLYRATDWILTMECLRGIGPVTASFDACRVDEGLLHAVLDGYYQLSRRRA
jgi:hypothetical protein